MAWGVGRILGGRRAAPRSRAGYGRSRRASGGSRSAAARAAFGRGLRAGRALAARGRRSFGYRSYGGYRRRY